MLFCNYTIIIFFFYLKGAFLILMKVRYQKRDRLPNYGKETKQNRRKLGTDCQLKRLNSASFGVFFMHQQAKYIFKKNQKGFIILSHSGAQIKSTRQIVFLCSYLSFLNFFLIEYALFIAKHAFILNQYFTQTIL